MNTRSPGGAAYPRGRTALGGLLFLLIFPITAAPFFWPEVWQWQWIQALSVPIIGAFLGFLISEYHSRKTYHRNLENDVKKSVRPAFHVRDSFNQIDEIAAPASNALIERGTRNIQFATAALTQIREKSTSGYNHAEDVIKHWRDIASNVVDLEEQKHEQTQEANPITQRQRVRKGTAGDQTES